MTQISNNNKVQNPLDKLVDNIFKKPVDNIEAEADALVDDVDSQLAKAKEEATQNKQNKAPSDQQLEQSKNKTENLDKELTADAEQRKEDVKEKQEDKRQAKKEAVSEEATEQRKSSLSKLNNFQKTKEGIEKFLQKVADGQENTQEADSGDGGDILNKLLKDTSHKNKPAASKTPSYQSALNKAKLAGKNAEGLARVAAQDLSKDFKNFLTKGSQANHSKESAMNKTAHAEAEFYIKSDGQIAKRTKDGKLVRLNPNQSTLKNTSKSSIKKAASSAESTVKDTVEAKVKGQTEDPVKIQQASKAVVATVGKEEADRRKKIAKDLKSKGGQEGIAKTKRQEAEKILNQLGDRPFFTLAEGAQRVVEEAATQQREALQNMISGVARFALPAENLVTATDSEEAEKVRNAILKAPNRDPKNLAQFLRIEQGGKIEIEEMVGEFDLDKTYGKTHKKAGAIERLLGIDEMTV